MSPSPQALGGGRLAESGAPFSLPPGDTTVDLNDYIRVARKRWRVIVASVVLTLLLAGIATLLTPARYESNTQVFVSTSGVTTAADLAAGTTFSQKQVKTYADLANTPMILDLVIRTLGLSQNAETLSESVTATVPPDTSLINIAVRDADPMMAANIANAITRQLTQTIPQLETVSRRQGSPVKATAVSLASAGEQVAPRPLRNLALGVILGLLLGLALALLRDRLDTSVKSESNIEEITDAPIVGGIHFDDQAAARPLIIHAEPHGHRSEAFRALRTNLQFIDVSNAPRVFTVTSSVAGEGKSTTTANLALALSAGGASVCIVEADLRRPKVLEYMGLESSVGLTNVLIGEAELDDVLQPFADTKVSVLGVGPIPPNPSELLGSDAMREVLEDLRGRFDYVLLDSPPLLAVTDAAVATRLVDGALIVVGSGIVRREQLARSLAALEKVGARALGLVLNRIPTRGHDSYDYHYGAYYYSTDKQTKGRGLRRRLGSAGKRTQGRRRSERRKNEPLGLDEPSPGVTRQAVSPPDEAHSADVSMEFAQTDAALSHTRSSAHS